MKKTMLIPALFAMVALSGCWNSGETSVYDNATWRNDTVSQRTMGDMFRIGQGAPQDDAKAMEWYSQACSEGMQEACDQYARMEKK